MGVAPYRIRQDYWENFAVSSEDIEFLYNYMLEDETPLTSAELTDLVIRERIRTEKSALSDQQSSRGAIYKPGDSYSIGQVVQFPALNWQKGTVTGARPGHNPEAGDFTVAKIEFPGGITREFATGLKDHPLNSPVSADLDDPLLNEAHVHNVYGKAIRKSLEAYLASDRDLARVSTRWFPRSLLLDIGPGYLNLVEAILEMAGGGPLDADAILSQLEIGEGQNKRLFAFSLNSALGDDSRFDDVGPTGQTSWYLHRLEPEDVRLIPPFLRFNESATADERVKQLLNQFEGTIADELEQLEPNNEEGDHITFPVLFPHLRAGTLPLSHSLLPFFPTAIESPRVQFTLVDEASEARYSAWVVRGHNYVVGLQPWYEANTIFPGSLVTLRKSDSPGEVLIDANRKRPTREWIRTVMIGSDGGMVFAMLKHSLATAYNERMAYAIPSLTSLDAIWEHSNHNRGPLAHTVKMMMRELAKLSPQGHIHAQELYAAVNMVRRCPPSPLLQVLIESPWSTYLGDLYFRLSDGQED